MKKILMDKNNEIRLGWAVLYGLITLFTPVLLIGFGGQLLIPNNEELQGMTTQFLMGTLGSAIVIAMGTFFFKRSLKPERYINFDLLKKKALPKLIMGVVIGAIFVAIETGILMGLGQVSFTFTGLPVLKVFSGIMTFFGMAMLEEVVFRGIIESTTNKFNMFAAVLLSATLFTLCHTDLWMSLDIMRAIELFTMGICFSLMMRATDSLSFVLGMHWAYNVVSAIFLSETTSVFTRHLTNGYNLLTGSEQNGGSLICILMSIAFSIVFYLYGKKQQKF